MKTHYIIAVVIIAVFFFLGCTTKESIDLKITIVPQYNSAVKPGDVDKASEVINKRLQYFFSIPEGRILSDANGNQMSFIISKIDTGKIGLIKDVITGYHKLEFWETYENKEIIGYLSEANNLLSDLHAHAAGADIVKPAKTITPADTIIKENQVVLDLIAKDTASTANSAVREEFIKQNPLFGILIPRVTTQGEPLPSCMIGLASIKDTSVINSYLKMDQIKALFPRDLKFYWSINPYRYDSSNLLYELHAIKAAASNKHAPLDGSVIVSAKPVKGSAGSGVRIDLSMNGEGARTWAGITRENINRCIAVVYDGHVRSYPRVMSEISGGNTEITGDFTIEEATGLCNILKSGELPFELRIIEEQIIKR